MPFISGATVASWFPGRVLRDIRRLIWAAVIALALVSFPVIAASDSARPDEGEGSAAYLKALPGESIAAADSLLKQFSAASACDALNEDMLVYFSSRMGVLVAEAIQELTRDNPEESAPEMESRIFSGFDDRADQHYQAALDQGCDDDGVQALIHRFRMEAQADEAPMK